MSFVPPAPPDPLTPCERRLLSLLARGQTTAEAAASLHLAPDDAQAMLAALLRRHGLAETRRLIARALLHRWI